MVIFILDCWLIDWLQAMRLSGRMRVYRWTFSTSATSAYTCPTYTMWTAAVGTFVIGSSSPDASLPTWSARPLMNRAFRQRCCWRAHSPAYRPKRSRCKLSARGTRNSSRYWMLPSHTRMLMRGFRTTTTLVSYGRWTGQRHWAVGALPTPTWALGKCQIYSSQLQCSEKKMPFLSTIGYLALRDYKFINSSI